MKTLNIISLLLILTFTSCATVQVSTDYDRQVNFNNYQSYAFYKPGIDKAEISDLDKRRILRAIDANLSEKGMIKSENPDLLISFFTKEHQRINIYNNHFGYNWYWNPYWVGGYHGGTVSTDTEGTLFIDIIDVKTNNLIWQGMGKGTLQTQNIDKKEAKINQIVSEILKKYPPEM